MAQLISWAAGLLLRGQWSRLPTRQVANNPVERREILREQWNRKACHDTIIDHWYSWSYRNALFAQPSLQSSWKVWPRNSISSTQKTWKWSKFLSPVYKEVVSGLRTSNWLAYIRYMHAHSVWTSRKESYPFFLLYGIFASYVVPRSLHQGTIAKAIPPRVPCARASIITRTTWEGARNDFRQVANPGKKQDSDNDSTKRLKNPYLSQ